MTDTISGKLHVSNDVLSNMIGRAALECYGIAGMSAPTAANSIASILPKSRLQKGVEVTPEEQGVHIDVYVIMEYGTNINTVSQNLTEQIEFVLGEYACVPVTGVDIHVQGIKVRR